MKKLSIAELEEEKKNTENDRIALEENSKFLKSISSGVLGK